MREYLRHLKIYFYLGIFFFIFFSFARIQLLKAHYIVSPETFYLGYFTIPYYLFIISLGSFVIATVLSALDIYVISKMMQRRSLLFVLITSIVLQLSTIVLVNILINHLVDYVFIFLFNQILESNTDKQSETITWITFLCVHVIFSRIIIEVDNKLGPGNLWKMMTGKFYKPREENRIFMFVDLKGSTSIAEKIGHKKYSLLLQDCFRDFSIVANYNAQIYQYVGDEVVISWKAVNKNYEQFLPAFFAFQNVIDRKKDYYTKNYGFQPVFKAGANNGLVIVTEVGEIKREITYHGDTLNTAARIQGKCNEFNSNMLISESLYNIVKSNTKYIFDDVGCIQLRGKEDEVKLFKVTEK